MVSSNSILSLVFIFVAVFENTLAHSCNETSLPNNIYVEDGVEYVNAVDRAETAKIIFTWKVSKRCKSLILILFYSDF